MRQSADVIIIGGGITGTAAAYELSRAGVNILVLEKGNLAAMGSGRTLAGVRQSGRHPAELPLALAAVQRWPGLGDELGADLEYRQRGNLRLAEDEGDTHTIKQMVQEQRDLGLDIHYLDGNSAVREVAPALAERIIAASYTPTDGHANPIATVHAYAEAATRAGARIHKQTMVTEITVESGRATGVSTTQGYIAADHVVVAAGIDSPHLLEPLGLYLPLALAMVPVVQTVPTAPLLDQVLGTAKAHFAARQEVDGMMRFSSGGRPLDLTPDAVTWESMQPTCARAGETLIRAVSILPGLSDISINTIWGGLIDLTPDGLPVMDRIPDVEGLTIAAGYSGHGFCLGPVSGEIIRDLVTGKPSRYPLEPFRWGRFAGKGCDSRAELLG